MAHLNRVSELVIEIVLVEMSSNRAHPIMVLCLPFTNDLYAQLTMSDSQLPAFNSRVYCRRNNRGDSSLPTENTVFCQDRYRSLLDYSIVGIWRTSTGFIEQQPACAQECLSTKNQHHLNAHGIHTLLPSTSPTLEISWL